MILGQDYHIKYSVSHSKALETSSYCLARPSCALVPACKPMSRSRSPLSRARGTLNTYSTRLRDWITCFTSDSGMIWRLALTNACAISSISASLGFGIGGRITGVLIRPRSQTAVLYRT